MIGALINYSDSIRLLLYKPQSLIYIYLLKTSKMSGLDDNVLRMFID